MNPARLAAPQWLRRVGPSGWLRLSLLAAVSTLLGCTIPGREAIRQQNAAADLAFYRERAPQVEGPITLATAHQLAAAHNMDAWLADLDRRFQRELTTQSLLKLLPSLLAGAENRRRSVLDAASSESLYKGTQSLEPSYSSDLRTRTWDISLTWSLLDFGVAFLRSRQAADREWIAVERARRVRQNLTLEVTRAYWQAVTARSAAEEAERAAAEVAAALERIAREVQQKTISNIEGLKSETRLLEQQEELRRYRRAYLTAKTELATLMGLEPGTPFELAEVELRAGPPADDLDVPALENEALLCRPELFEKDHEESISRDEAWIALAQMFPNLSLLYRKEGSDNRFLVFKEWDTTGLRATWDLLLLPQQFVQLHAARLQTDLIARRRAAVAVAILTQLHLALIDCQEAAEQCQTTGVLAGKSAALLAAIESAAEEGKSHGGEALDYRMKYLKARARFLAALADAQVARARLHNTLGRDSAAALAAAPPPAPFTPAASEAQE